MIFFTVFQRAAGIVPEDGFNRSKNFVLFFLPFNSGIFTSLILYYYNVLLIYSTNECKHFMLGLCELPRYF